MKLKMKTETVLTIMKILVLIVFFAYCIACALFMISYAKSLFNPHAANDIHMGPDLYELKENNFLKYSILVACLILLSALKANVWYRVTRIIQNIKMENPFTMEITHRLEKISYILLNIWILGFIASTFAFWLTNQNEMAYNLHETLNSKGFLFMAGLLFIVSQIFKRGVELQSENVLMV